MIKYKIRGSPESTSGQRGGCEGRERLRGKKEYLIVWKGELEQSNGDESDEDSCDDRSYVYKGDGGGHIRPLKVPGDQAIKPVLELTLVQMRITKTHMDSLKVCFNILMNPEDREPSHGLIVSVNLYCNKYESTSAR